MVDGPYWRGHRHGWMSALHCELTRPPAGPALPMHGPIQWANSMSKSRKGEKQRQHHGSRQPCDKDGAAQRSAENDLAASGLLGRIRCCRLFVPFGHRWIGPVFMHLVTNARLSRALRSKPKQDERFLAARLKMRRPAHPRNR